MEIMEIPILHWALAILVIYIIIGLIHVFTYIIIPDGFYLSDVPIMIFVIFGWFFIHIFSFCFRRKYSREIFEDEAP